MAKTGDLKSILSTALERERQGKGFYERAARATTNEKGKHMFEWLIRVEQGHIEKLSRQLGSIERTGSLEKMTHDNPKRAKKTDLPSAPEVSGAVTQATTELEALAMGMKAEKEAQAFYSKAAAETSDTEAKTLLSHLADDEQEHFAVLEEEYAWLKKSGEYFTIHRFQLPASR